MNAARPRRGPPVILMEERLWPLVQSSQNYDHNKPISKKAQTALRHEPNLRERDGAVCWPKLMQLMHDPHPKTRSWNFDKWLDAISDAPDRVTFGYRFDPHGETQYIRSIQGHSSVPSLYPKFFTLLETLYEWTVHNYHTGSLNNYRSIVEGRPIDGGTSDRRGRQACLLSAMDLWREVVARCP